jgi:tRNA G46 methylase TrmB
MISGFSKLRSLTVFFYQVSVLQIRSEPRRWRSFTAKPPATDLGKVINHQSGADCAFTVVKASDSAAMVQLLHNGNKFFLDDNPEVVITDVGCGDGSWMLPVFFDFFRHAGKILFNGIEPHQPSLQEFEQKIIQANSQIVPLSEFF